MNNIEKQIEEIEDTEEILEEDREEDNIKRKLNRNRDADKRNKTIIYIVIAVLVVALLTAVIYIITNDRTAENNIDNNNNINETDNNNQNEDEPVSNTENSNIGYVSCDDNTALLNVRNSTTGNIIDGLSCYKEVTIEEELEGTDTCDNWYKISYTKNGNNYTGYSCGTYIKKLEVSQNIMENTKDLINKANNYYENSVLTAYCGSSSSSKEIAFEDNMTGEYVKSEYKTIEDLKKYILSFLDEDLLISKLEISDINNPKIYDNYYEIDGNLYCRNYSGKGWLTYYTGNYDIEITNVTENKITANIAYEYLAEDSKCDLDNLSNCSKSNLIYEIGKVIIENNIITKIDFHK